MIAYALLKLMRLQSVQGDVLAELKSLYSPLLLLGIYIAVTGVFGNLLWPLPGSYNILFYDLYPLLGIGLIAIAISIKNRTKLEYIGFLALLLGLVTIYYGTLG